jgi:hypothetical protein
LAGANNKPSETNEAISEPGCIASLAVSTVSIQARSSAEAKPFRISAFDCYRQRCDSQACDSDFSGRLPAQDCFSELTIKA